MLTRPGSGARKESWPEPWATTSPRCGIVCFGVDMHPAAAKAQSATTASRIRMSIGRRRMALIHPRERKAFLVLVFAALIGIADGTNALAAQEDQLGDALV